MSSTNRPLTILCAGAYGIQNAGDDLPLVCLAAGMRRMLPGRELRFRALSRHPDPWEEKTYGVTMVQNPEYESREAAEGRWFRGLNPDDDPEAFELICSEVRNCDLLVLGAGNALLDKTIGLLRGPIPLLALYGSLARLYHKPLMLYGLSVGPLTTTWGRDLSRGLLEMAAVTTVRDRASLALCTELCADSETGADGASLRTTGRIHLLPDATLAAAALAPDEDSLPPGGYGGRILAEENLSLPGDRPVLALGLRDLHRPLGSEAGRALEDSIMGMINELKDEVCFLFIPQSTYREDDDRKLARQLIARAAGEAPGAQCLAIVGRHHPLHLIDLYGLAQATIAVRLHSAVFSALAGVPAVGVSYLPKVAGFMEQLGPDHPVYGLDELNADRLAQTALRLLDTPRSVRSDLLTRVDELGKQALRHAELAVTAGLGITND